MTVKLIIPNTAKHEYHDPKLEFSRAVKLGLSACNKKISSKFFYDKNGCELFNKITRHKDYYLTQCEIDILNKYKNTISKILHHEKLNLIELGPGEGIKTEILIKQLLADSQHFSYFPIDISQDYLNNLMNQFKTKLPSLEMAAINCDYFEAIKWLSCISSNRNCVLFLGSSIGNFDINETKVFLQNLWNVLHDGDYVLFGFDLCKKIDILMRAYNDSDGITRDFNLNLLHRMNNELGANFNIKKFFHYTTYNVYQRAMESYLMSAEDQSVKIDDLQVNFKTFEPIHVEFSHKYLLSQITELAAQFNYEIVNNFIDDKSYFVDSLWRVKK